MNKLVKDYNRNALQKTLPVTVVHASSNQYWTEQKNHIEHVMNDQFYQIHI